MRLSLPSRKLASLLAVTACLGAATSGCFFSDDDGHGDGDGDGYVPPDPTPPTTEPRSVTIDADATLQATPGDGVGLFVEYATGGHWNVFTTCDYNTPSNPGVPCAFDVYATPLETGVTIDNPKGQGLSGKDTVEIQADGTVHLYTEATTGSGGLTFDTPPGAAVELEVYLDGSADPHFVYWVGDSVLHTGAPTDPLDFHPSEPAPSTGGGGIK